MTSTQEPLPVVQALDAACNAHDLESVMALFADDAVVRHTPPPDGVGLYRGKAQIRDWMEPQLPGFHVVTRDHRTTGDTVRWSGTVTHDLLRQIGQDQPVDALLEAVIRDGQIASFSVTNPSLIAS